MTWPREADAVLTFTRRLTPLQVLKKKKPETIRAFHWRPGDAEDCIILREGEGLRKGDLVVCRDEEPVIKWIMSAGYFAENYK